MENNCSSHHIDSNKEIDLSTFSHIAFQKSVSCLGQLLLVFLFFFFNLFLVVLGLSLLLHRFFSSCGEWGLLSSCNAQASHCSGFSCCWARTLGHSASAGVPGLLEHKLGHCGTQAYLICSMWTRDWNPVSCTDKLILYHWATREALPHLFFLSYVVGIYSVT